MPEGFFLAEHVHDMSFRDVGAFGNASPQIYSQANTSKPASTTSPIQRKKVKGKCKANVSDDAICELTTTIKNTFELVRSS